MVLYFLVDIVNILQPFLFCRFGGANPEHNGWEFSKVYGKGSANMYKYVQRVWLYQSKYLYHTHGSVGTPRKELCAYIGGWGKQKEWDVLAHHFSSTGQGFLC